MMEPDHAKAYLVLVYILLFVTFFIGMSFGWRTALNRAEMTSIEIACKPPIAFMARCYGKDTNNDQ